jgi:hypothetical protein
MANRNFSNGGKIMMMESGPVLVSCNFIVDSTNGNGLGIRSLKGPMISNVYMHTSATPAVGNPNPESGIIVVQFQDNFNRSLAGFNTIVTPLSGSSLAVNASALTAGNPYVIVSLGTSTAADWIALGVPAGIAPAVGVAFIAKVAGSGSGSGMVQAPASAGSNITNIETVGDPNTMIAPNPNANQGYGASLILQCMKNAALTAPANNSVISLTFLLSNSSVKVQGQ